MHLSSGQIIRYYLSAAHKERGDLSLRTNGWKLFAINERIALTTVLLLFPVPLCTEALVNPGEILREISQLVKNLECFDTILEMITRFVAHDS